MSNTESSRWTLLDSKAIDDFEWCLKNDVFHSCYTELKHGEIRDVYVKCHACPLSKKNVNDAFGHGWCKALLKIITQAIWDHFTVTASIFVGSGMLQGTCTAALQVSKLQERLEGMRFVMSCIKNLNSVPKNVHACSRTTGPNLEDGFHQPWPLPAFINAEINCSILGDPSRLSDTEIHNKKYPKSCLLLHILTLTGTMESSQLVGFFISLAWWILAICDNFTIKD